MYVSVHISHPWSFFQWTGVILNTPQGKDRAVKDYCQQANVPIQGVKLQVLSTEKLAA